MGAWKMEDLVNFLLYMKEADAFLFHQSVEQTIVNGCVQNPHKQENLKEPIPLVRTILNLDDRFITALIFVTPHTSQFQI
jgi:hypothetical protein